MAVSTALLFVALGGSVPALPERDDPAPMVAPPVPVAAPSAPPAAAPKPPPRPPTRRPAVESTRYRIFYGMLGELGELAISLTFPGKTIEAVAEGKGSLLGMGQLEKRLQSEIDFAALTPQHWIASRRQGGKTITDTVRQPAPGTIALVRRRPDKPDEPQGFVRSQVVLDPLTFLWRLRFRPPRTTEVFEVLDGRALWLITINPIRSATLENHRAAWELRGQADPIFWDGKPDKDRTARGFTLWFDADPYRTPLRLVMPLPIGEVRVNLASVTRPPAAPRQMANGQAYWRTPPVSNGAAPRDQVQRQPQQDRPAPQLARRQPP